MTKLVSLLAGAAMALTLIACPATEAPAPKPKAPAMAKRAAATLPLEIVFGAPGLDQATTDKLVAALGQKKGIMSAKPNMAAGTLQVVFDPTDVKPQQVHAAVTAIKSDMTIKTMGRAKVAAAKGGCGNCPNAGKGGCKAHKAAGGAHAGHDHAGHGHAHGAHQAAPAPAGCPHHAAAAAEPAAAPAGACACGKDKCDCKKNATGTAACDCGKDCKCAKDGTCNCGKDCKCAKDGNCACKKNAASK